MFEPVGNGEGKGIVRHFLTFLLSAAMHTVALLFLVILPLLFFSSLPDYDLLTILIAAPPKPLPPPPAFQVKQVPVEPRPFTAVADTILRAPDRIPQGIPVPEDEPMVVDPVTVPMGIQTAAFGAASGLAAIGTVLVPAVPIVPIPPPPPPASKPHVRVGGEVQQAKLLVKIAPDYPDLAKRARISGRVILEIRVDEDGNVTDVAVLSGHPLLSEAAARAAARWRYSPTLLNGEPVPVIATVTMVFTLQ